MDLLSLWACRHYSVQWTQVCNIVYRYLLHVCLQVCDIICKTKELKYLMSQHKSPPRTGFSRTFLLGIEDIFVIIYIVLLNSYPEHWVQVYWESKNDLLSLGIQLIHWRCPPKLEYVPLNLVSQRFTLRGGNTIPTWWKMTVSFLRYSTCD